MDTLGQFFKDISIVLERASEVDDYSSVNNTAQHLLFIAMTIQEGGGWSRIEEVHADSIAYFHHEATLIELERN